jgi:hypothetical protein
MTKSAKKRIYSSKLTPEQNEALHHYEALCGMEPLGIDAFESGEISAAELWNQNLRWIHDVFSDIQNINFPSDDSPQ